MKPKKKPGRKGKYSVASTVISLRVPGPEAQTWKRKFERQLKKAS